MANSPFWDRPTQQRTKYNDIMAWFFDLDDIGKLSQYNKHKNERQYGLCP